MRIAFVVHDYNRVLGHSRYVAELAERFAAAHDVHVFANRFDRLPAGIVPHRVPAVRMSALATIFSFPLPASMMVGHGFDIVHAQGLTVFSPDIVTAHISNARWLEGRRLLEGDNLSWRERRGDRGPGLVDVAQDRDCRGAAEQHRDAERGRQASCCAERYAFQSGPA